MKRRFSWLLAILLILPAMISTPAQGQKSIDKIDFPPLRDFDLPPVHKARMDNGIRIRLIKEPDVPIVSLYALFQGGEGYEKVGKNLGVSSVTAQMLRIGGTRETAPEELDRLLDSQGISISFSSQRDYFLVHMTCLKEKFGKAVELMSEMLTDPAFDEDKLTEVKTQLRSSLARRNDEPAPINSREFDRILYGEDHPFGAVMNYEALKRLNRETVAENYRRFFAPGNMLTGVIGPLELMEVTRVLEGFLGNWEHQSDLPQYTRTPDHDPGFKMGFAQKDNLNQSYLSIGHLGIQGKLEAPEKARIKVFNAIFSGGFAGRLMNRVRTKMGLTYGIGGGIMTPRRGRGKTYISTFTKSESTIQAIDAILEEIRKIQKEEVTIEELNLAKDYFRNSYVFEFSTPAQILLKQLTNEFYGVEADYDARLLRAVEEVTVSDVHRIAKEYLNPEEMVIFVLGNRELIKGDFNKYGKTREIGITIPALEPEEKIPPSTPKALEKGRRVVEKSLQGPYSGYRKLKTLQREMTMNMDMQGRKMTMEVTSRIIYPDKFYSEMTVMGMKMERVINGDRGVMRRMGQESPLPEDQVQGAGFGSTYDMMHNPRQYRYQYLETKTVDGEEYHVLYVTSTEGDDWKKLYVHTGTGFFEIEEQTGPQGLIRNVSSDFRMVEGIPFSFRQETWTGEKKINEVTVKSTTVNPEIDPDLFKLE